MAQVKATGKGSVESTGSFSRACWKPSLPRALHSGCESADVITISACDEHLWTTSVAAYPSPGRGSASALYSSRKDGLSTGGY